MAAYAALVSLFNDLELIPIHPIHSFSFDSKQLTSLSQIVNSLIDFMDTYDSHGCTTEAAQVLESKMASAAHAAHDVVESHIVDQIHGGSTLGGKARLNYFLLDLQKAIDNMDFVKRKAVQFKAKSGLKAEFPTYSAPASSKPLKNVMVGFDDVALRLLEMVTGEPSGRRVIPVVGMGGLGKTTLAKHVYEHLLIKDHFDIRVWATISQEYNVETILNELLFGERKATCGNVSELGEQMHKMLWGRRYLVVLDDMWSVEAWDEIQMFLPNSGNGSHVIVTSRISKLAAPLGSSPFVMNFLDEDKSWELFCGKAFGEEECPVELEKIGKKIVKRCRGLPLSIVVIGGHLRRASRAVEYWKKISNFMNPISSLEEDDQCLKIISLSYKHLPAHLKPCFLYMGIFEEDKRIDISELLRFWVAEGFLKAEEGMSLEEVGEGHLNDLVDRNLIIAHTWKWNGKVEYCGVHDIVRELCVKVSKKEKFMRVVEDTTQATDIKRERRVVIQKGMKLKSDLMGAVESALLLRSLVHRKGGKRNVCQLRLLRVSVGVNDIYSEDFSDALFQQVNLRHADFCIKLTDLGYLISSSISQFWNIQSLVIRNNVSVPYEIWEMTQLRHLMFTRNSFLPDPVPQQERIVLQNLHTLKGVENLRLTEEVCKRMPNLKDLQVEYNIYCYDCGVSSYYLHNLDLFKKLKKLSINFDCDSKLRDDARSLRIPSSVEELTLRNCHFDWEDFNMITEDLPHLRYLSVRKVQGLKWNVLDDQFPSLLVLDIYVCKDLRYWNANSSQFPVLERLKLFRVRKLSEIPFDIGEIPTLRSIEMRILVEQESLGNEDLQLDVRFNKMVEVERFQKMMQEEGLRSNSLCLRHRYKRIKDSKL